MGSRSRRRNEPAATTIPPDANGRDPNRSERIARRRPGQEEARCQRQHVDAGPQGVRLKLKPWRGSQIPWSQMISMNMRPPRPTPASREERLPAVKARILNSGKRNIGSATSVLYQGENHQQNHAAAEAAEHERARPPHGGVAVGLDAVGDADQNPDQAQGEGDVPRPVEARGRPPGHLAEFGVGPDRAEEAGRHRDQEDEAPLDRRQHPTEDQADE